MLFMMYSTTLTELYSMKKDSLQIILNQTDVQPKFI